MNPATSQTRSRSDRAWTAVVAECGLDRARPVLALLLPEPFGRIDLAAALAKTDLVLDRNVSFDTVLRPRLADCLGDQATDVFDALARLPFDRDACPATSFWRSMFRDLHGDYQPALTEATLADWTAFLDSVRGRVPRQASPDWLLPVADGLDAFRNLLALVKTQRGGPLSLHDRSLYARFGWNDDGPIPGMGGLLNAAALMRIQGVWATAALHFGPESQLKIEAAAQRCAELERDAALETADADAKRYGVPRARIESELFPPRAVPPLSAILMEII